MAAGARAVWRRQAQQDAVIIDAHAHCGPYSLFHIARNTPADMVRVMDRCGVGRTLLCSHLGLQLDARAGNRDTAAAVADFPHRLAGYLTINPRQDPVAELAHWDGDPRFVGIKVHPDEHEYPLTGPRYRPVWEYASQTGFPVLTHTWHLSPYDDVALLGRVAEAAPEANLIAGHSGVLPHGFDRAIEVARRYPRLYLELCGSHNHGRVIERMIDEIGAAKVMYGSDFPFIDMRGSLGRVLFADLAEADRDAVLGGTIGALLPARMTTVPSAQG
jgi:hypothetical protein